MLSAFVVVEAGRYRTVGVVGRLPGLEGEVVGGTSCPACLQGLSRYREEVPVESAYVITELVNHKLGKDWQKRFLEQVKQGGMERVLL